MISAVTPRFAALIAETVPCRLASVTVMSVVTGLLDPTLIETVIGLDLNALVSDAKALETLRCSWAIWLTVTLFDPALADEVELAEKADSWELLTVNVLKSFASFSRSAASFTTLSIDTAFPRPLIFASDSAILELIRASAGAFPRSLGLPRFFSCQNLLRRLGLVRNRCWT